MKPTIAVLANEYHMVRIIEMMLQREGFSVSCFGKVERLEASTKPFDQLILEPGKFPLAFDLVKRLETWRPPVRRILVTTCYENYRLCQDFGLNIIVWPCARYLLLATLRKQNPFTLDLEEVPCDAESHFKPSGRRQ